MPSDLGEAGTLPSRCASGGGCTRCKLVPEQHQSRGGNPGNETAGSSGPGWNCIATPVTCPTISASSRLVKFLIEQGDKGCGSSVRMCPSTSHQEQAYPFLSSRK